MAEWEKIYKKTGDQTDHKYLGRTWSMEEVSQMTLLAEYLRHMLKLELEDVWGKTREDFQAMVAHQHWEYVAILKKDGLVIQSESLFNLAPFL